MESALRHGLGARIELPSEADPFVWLFSESAGRALVSVKDGGDRRSGFSVPDSNGVIVDKARVRSRPTRTRAIEVVGQFTMPLARIREAWHGSIPVVMAAH